MSENASEEITRLRKERDAYYEQERKKTLEHAKREGVPVSNDTVNVKDTPMLAEDAFLDGKPAYAAFVARFNSLSKPSTWDIESANLRQALESFDAALEPVPAGEIGRVEAMLDSAKAQAPQGSYDDILKAMPEFQSEAERATAAQKKLRESLQPLMGRAKALLSAVEDLKTQDGSAEKLDGLLKNQVPEFLTTIEAIQSEGTQKAIRDVADLRLEIEKKWKKVDDLIGKLLNSKFVPSDVKKELQDLREKGEKYIKDADRFLDSLSQLAAVSPHLAAAFAANPWVAAAVAAIMVIFSLLKKPGKGPGEGPGKGPGEGQGSTTPGSGGVDKEGSGVQQSTRTNVPYVPEGEAAGAPGDTKADITFPPVSGDTKIAAYYRGEDLHFAIRAGGNEILAVISQANSRNGNLFTLSEASSITWEGSEPGKFPLTLRFKRSGSSQDVAIRWTAADSFTVDGLH